MRRREFIVLLAGLGVWPLVARAQQPAKLKRIGFLNPAVRGPYVDVFLSGLRELGWIEERNIVIEWRHAAGDFAKLKEFAAEFERLKLDVVVTAASAATQAMQEVTKTVPIVFLATGDPVGQKFVKSLSHPGGKYHWHFF